MNELKELEKKLKKLKNLKLQTINVNKNQLSITVLL